MSKDDQSLNEIEQSDKKDNNSKLDKNDNVKTSDTLNIMKWIIMSIASYIMFILMFVLAVLNLRKKQYKY